MRLSIGRDVGVLGDPLPNRVGLSIATLALLRCVVLRTRLFTRCSDGAFDQAVQMFARVLVPLASIQVPGSVSAVKPHVHALQ